MGGKGPQLLGVKAVIAESFERIHRSNLIGMGILPLQFIQGQTRHSLNLKGDETLSITINDKMHAGDIIEAEITNANGQVTCIKLQSRIDTSNELSYYHHGGILQYVLRQILSGKK